MRITRVYINQKIQVASTIELPKEISLHIITVLKSKIGENIILFNNLPDYNNNYGEYTAEIIAARKNSATVKINDYNIKSTIAPINIELAQCISKPLHFDVTLQKSVELGVNTITPIISSRSEQVIKHDNLDNKILRWQKIIISAAEQSGRTDLPILNNPISLENWLYKIRESNQDMLQNTMLISMCTKTNNTLKNINNNINNYKYIKIIVGPEGGLSLQETELLNNNNFTLVKLGPRILRTETASITMLSILQYMYGDFS